MTHTAIYEYDPDEVWLVHLHDEPRCHSYGRTLAAAKRNIRDAANLWFETDVDIVDRVEPPAAAREAVERARELRVAAEEANKSAAGSVEDAVVALRRAGLSVREAGEVLRLSFQRIGQVSKRAAASHTGADLQASFKKATATKKRRAKV
jgi:predicted RNase H-like HicB family nuclease